MRGGRMEKSPFDLLDRLCAMCLRSNIRLWSMPQTFSLSLSLFLANDIDVLVCLGVSRHRRQHRHWRHLHDRSNDHLQRPLLQTLHRINVQSLVGFLSLSLSLTFRSYFFFLFSSSPSFLHFWFLFFISHTSFFLLLQVDHNISSILFDF